MVERGIATTGLKRPFSFLTGYKRLGIDGRAREAENDTYHMRILEPKSAIKFAKSSKLDIYNKVTIYKIKQYAAMLISNRTYVCRGTESSRVQSAT